MTMEGKCRICGRELTLEVSDEYASKKDPFKLVPKATCNRCYDLRDHRLKSINNINILSMNIPRDKDARDRREKLMAHWLRRYAETTMAQRGKQNTVQVEEIAQAIIEQPSKLVDIMAHFRAILV